MEIEIEETSSGVEVRTRLPKGGLFSEKGKVDYQITLPATASVNVRTVNGRLVFTGVGGRLEAKTVNGSVEFERARGEVVATTVNGSIQASYEALDERGRNRFSTTNGSVRIELPRDANGEFEARTVNGRIRSDFDELGPPAAGDIESSPANWEPAAAPSRSRPSTARSGYREESQMPDATLSERRSRIADFDAL